MRLDHGCVLAVLTLAAACAGPSQGGEATGAGTSASASAAPAAAPAATTTTSAGAAGAFAPSRAPNPQYGAPGGYSCPGGGVMDELKTSAGALGKDARSAPAPDPRLCAAAEAFLSWKDPAALPPESVSSFASWYFGSPTPTLRILGATLDTDDARVIAERLLQPLSQFAAGATAPRYGVFTQTTTRGDRRAAAARQVKTRLVLAMQDVGVELTQPVPRQLPAGGTARLEGRVLADVARTTVLVGDPSGKLETIGPKDGPSFAADLKCGAKSGVLLVEVRGEQAGAATAAARFPIGCGVELPRSTPIPPPAGAAVDPAAAEKQLLDAVNVLRASAGVAPLAPDDAVARVARDASVAQSRATGSAVDFDVAGALAKAEVPSPLVLLNPAAAFTPDEAQWRLTTSPQHRSNMLNPQATHAGVGVTSSREGKEGVPVYYVTELFVRELPPIDAEAMRAKVRDAVATRRREARADPVKPDPLLEDVAQKYAAALAAGKGKPPEQTLNEVVSPLYKAMRVVSVTAGTKLEPLEIVEEPGVASAGKVFGVGVAQGFNTVLGKNAVYVAIIVGSRK